MARICILLLTLAVAALGQTSADLSAKYPNVIAYRIRPHVLMTARFAADGQVCETTLEKGQGTDSSIVLDDSFSKGEVHSLMDDLVPEGLRGRNLTRRFNGSIEGFSVTTVYRQLRRLPTSGRASDNFLFIDQPENAARGSIHQYEVFDYLFVRAGLHAGQYL